MQLSDKLPTGQQARTADLRKTDDSVAGVANAVV